MQVLAFRHSPSDGLGLIGDTLQAHDIECQCADVYAAPSHDVSVADADALIVLGGAMSANDGLEFIHREMECIRTAIGLGKPVLGICLGAQMIAKALGALVYANPTTEIGWAPVQFTQAALSDPVLCGHRCEVIFHWHRETFDLPEGGCLLASSAACRHQAFRLGDRVYGFQFHLEVTPEIIIDWCPEEVTRCIDPYAHSARSMDVAHTVFGRWCDLIRQQTGSSSR